ncbi:unnamed protein product [Lasius platythorax]|uniref:Tantalus-like domain-containing protein n=1 Tax=Lasius platythorax TaxID=488582 RepID=A0AAV2NAD3_9HYME
MDEGQTDNTISVDCSDNTTVPVVTANLEMLTIDVNSSSTEPTKRVLRKKISKSVSTDVLNRRCSLKPKKRRLSEIDTDEENIKEYYLDKKINKKINLETIYEESDSSSDDTRARMSAKKFKRMLLFSPTASKLKKRRVKVQRVFGSKIRWYKRYDMQATRTINNV